MGLLRILHRWRRMVLALALGLPIVTAIVVAFLPNLYAAEGTILLEMAESQPGLEVLSQITALTGMPSQAPSADAYMAILRSRRVGAAVADSLDLADHFGVRAASPEQRMEKTLLKLKERMHIENPDQATLRLRATDRDPVLAAAMVNGFLDQLIAANQTLALTRARRTRQLVEHGMTETETELEAARGRMAEFQTKYGVFSLDDQTRGTLDLVAELQGKLLEAQTQRDALAGLYQEGSAAMRNLDHLIAALEERIHRIVGELPAPPANVAGMPPAAPPAGQDGFMLPLKKVSALGGAYAHLFLDLKVLEAKYNVLATRFEQTKIEESQSVPTFEVLDRAERPFRKSGPNRKLFVGAAFLGGLLAGILLAVLLEDLDRRLDSETRSELLSMLPPSVAARLRAGARPAAGGEV